MRPDHQHDRLRLVVEPERDREPEAGEMPSPDNELRARRMPEEEDRPERQLKAAPRARWLPVLIGLIALGGFAGLVWYAYNWGAGAIAPEELPLIRAAPGPVKVRPEDPGGLEVPHQDTMVLNNIRPDPAQPQVERLLPPPEAPQPPQPAVEPSETAEPGTAVSEAAPEAEPAESPDQPAPDAPAAPAPSAQSTEPSAPSAQTGEPAPAPAPEPAAQPDPAPAPAAAPPARQQAALPSGGFAVQLASLKDEAGIQREWNRLREAFPTLLGDKRLLVETADLGGRGTFHRLRAGVLPDRASAEALCAQLRAKRQPCLVIQR